MADFFYIIHYVIYRFYRRHKEAHDSAIMNAFAILGALSLGLILMIDHYGCLFLDIPKLFKKIYIPIYAILWMIFEYIVLYRNERYREIFDEYDRLSNTPEMETKLRNAKIFNYCLLAVNLLSLIIADYLNHHK